MHYKYRDKCYNDSLFSTISTESDGGHKITLGRLRDGETELLL